MADGRQAQAEQQTLAAVGAIWERFRAASLQRVEALERASMALIEGSLDPAARREAERAAHKLAGALGSFGFHDGSPLARAVEQALRGDAPLDGAAVLRMADQVAALRRVVERPAAPPAAEEPAAAVDERPLLLAVVPEGETADRLAVEADRRGLRVTAAHSVPGVAEALAAGRPDLVLLDLEVGGLALLADLVARTPAAPVLVADSGGFGERVEAARLGGRGFLPKPLSATQALDAVGQALERTRATLATILAVDDDPLILAVLRSVLADAGLAVATEGDPLRFWEALERARPDLLILDVDMPSLNGIELCQVVRGDPRWASLPILFLTAHTDAATVRRVFTAGADDFVSKPIVGPELLARIGNRLERTRLQRAMAETDYLTGLPNRHTFERLLAPSLRLARRLAQPLALAALDVDGLRAVNDWYGRGSGDEALRRLGKRLRQSFRGEDVAARWSADEFVVAMHGLRRADGVQRLTELLEELRGDELPAPGGGRFSVTFSAGVAAYPADGGDLEALYRAASAALGRAEALGGDRVVPAGAAGDEEAAEDVDVAVVDDDAALAELLVHALRTRGYRTCWLADGEEAALALGGVEPRVRARVVLLDWDLPGLDGPGVLRRLARGGALRHARVIMLTARSSEGETLGALEQGAFDHVAKPFSLPILLRRVRRAMER